MQESLPRCRHCEERFATRPRGLCWPCYGDTTIREQYPRYFSPLMVGVGGQDSLPETSTDALPGSEEKIMVFEERVAKGVSLFHPGDARFSKHNAVTESTTENPTRLFIP